jgi:ABC-type proline/glycine betaine transport system permease subunit
MAVDPVDTGAGTTRAMAMEADMVRRQRSTTEAVVEEVIKAIKARGTNNHRTLVVMTVDKEVMEGIEATTVVTVAMVVAIAARSG